MSEGLGFPTVARGVVPFVKLQWYADRRSAGALGAKAWLECARRLFPEAVPVRFGPVDPMRGVLERDGDEQFCSGVESETLIFFFTGSSPVIEGNMAVGGRDDDVVSWSVAVHEGALVDPGWSSPMEAFFVEFAVAVDAIFASAQVVRDAVWTGRRIAFGPATPRPVGLAGGGEWRGLPPHPPVWAWFGEEYRALVAESFPQTAEARSGADAFVDLRVVDPEGRWVPAELRATRRAPAQVMPARLGEWRAFPKAAQREAQQKARIAAAEAASRPILERLRTWGLEADQIYELDGSVLPPEARDYLLDCLEPGDLLDTVGWEIGTLFQTAAARPWWPRMRSLYEQSGPSKTKEALSYALAKSASKNEFDHIAEIVADERHGIERVAFLSQLKRIGGYRGLELLESFRDHPQLGTEARSCLRSPRRRPTSGRPSPY